MRICIVRHFYYPLDPRVRREVEALKEQGHEVDIICLRGASEALREEINGVRVYRLPLFRYRGSFLRYLLAYSAFFLLASALLLLLHLRRRYRVIQVNTMPDFIVFVTLLPRLMGARVLLDMHEAMPELYRTMYKVDDHWLIRALERVEQISIRYADHVTTVTEPMKQTFIRRGADPAKITVVPNAPDRRLLNPDLYPPCLEKDAFTLISHGTLLERYGLDTLLKAVALLKDEIPQLRVEILGDGPYLGALVELAEALGVREKVEFAGYVPFEEMLRRIAEADIGVVASKRCPWSDISQTNKMLDYIAMRKPIVISRTQGVAPYYHNPAFAFFEPDDEKDLARVILDLYRHPEKRRALIAHVDRLYEHIEWRKVQHRYWEVMEALGGD